MAPARLRNFLKVAGVAAEGTGQQPGVVGAALVVQVAHGGLDVGGRFVTGRLIPQDPVPMVADVAAALRRLRQRGVHIAAKDPVFANEDGEPIDGSALRRRCLSDLETAGLHYLRFHDLRHTFGSLAINSASIVQVQDWIGHMQKVERSSPFIRFIQRPAPRLGPLRAS